MQRQKNKNARRMRKGRQNNQGYQLKDNTGYTQVANPRWTFLDPHQYIVEKYNEIVTFNLATVTGTQQLYNLNSIFDPNRTGTGHQPYGFDQIAALYNRYRVLRVHWKLSFGVAASDYFVVVLPLNGSITAITNQTTWEAAAELPSAKSTIVSSSGKTMMLSGSIALNELNGVTRTEYLADDRFEAQVGASPSELIVLHIGFYNSGGVTIGVNMIAELKYEVDFHDPVIAAQS